MKVEVRKIDGKPPALAFELTEFPICIFGILTQTPFSSCVKEGDVVWNGVKELGFPQRELYSSTKNGYFCRHLREDEEILVRKGGRDG